MKRTEGVVVQLHAVLTSTLHGCQQSASCPAALPRDKEPPSICLRTGGPQSQSRQKENIPLLLKSYKNSSIFQDIIPCRSVKVNRHITSIFRAEVSQARNQHEVGCEL
jgi:hypothetical protein